MDSKKIKFIMKREKKRIKKLKFKRNENKRNKTFYDEIKQTRRKKN
jgi:hypothetical protein